MIKINSVKFFYMQNLAFLQIKKDLMGISIYNKYHSYRIQIRSILKNGYYFANKINSLYFKSAFTFSLNKIKTQYVCYSLSTRSYFAERDLLTWYLMEQCTATYYFILQKENDNPEKTIRQPPVFNLSGVQPG